MTDRRFEEARFILARVCKYGIFYLPVPGETSLEKPTTEILTPPVVSYPILLLRHNGVTALQERDGPLSGPLAVNQAT